MRWTKEANEALSKVPFFVRKRVRKRVEEEVSCLGSPEVGLEHVRTCMTRFLSHMEDEVKGYQVETCFGPGGCCNRAVTWGNLPERLEERISRRKLKEFLIKRVKGHLKIHHEFRVSISDCPNACSRPQIVDFGLIGASKPLVSNEACSNCQACTGVCGEGAISYEADLPVVDYSRCISCGQCLTVCPTGTLREGARGYRILVGGKLGRHPQLGRELPGVYPLENVLDVIDGCLDYYQENCINGERLGEILNRTGTDWFTRSRENTKKK